MLGQRWTPESSGKQVPAHLVCTGGPLGVATLHWTCLKLVNSEELARAGFAGGGFMCGTWVWQGLIFGVTF